MTLQQLRYLLAIAELQDSLALNPDNPLANYHLGWAYYEKKEFKKARAYMAKALALDVFSVINKPVDMSILLDQLNRLFTRRYNSAVFSS